MNYALSRLSSSKDFSQVRVHRLLLAILLKERNRLSLILAFFFSYNL